MVGDARSCGLFHYDCAALSVCPAGRLVTKHIERYRYMERKSDMEWKNQQVLIVGAGKSGIGAAKMLAKCGAEPVLFDENENVSVCELAEQLKDYSSVKICTKTLPEEMKSGIKLAVLSPGVPVDAPFAENLKRSGIRLWGEIELAYSAEKGTVTAITGTNGKTTTTTLVGQILQEAFGNTFVVGNIGAPYTEAALLTKAESYTVAEISSFQLETIHEFHPHVSAILNITPDHLNRHKTMENYIRTKENITKNQTKEDVCVLNYDNIHTRAFAAQCPARVVFFSSKERLSDGYFLEGEEIFRAGEGSVERLMDVREAKLVGVCNYENIMAAMAIAEALHVPMERILHTVRKFQAVEHRIEFVDTKNGVDYYNDSKGTNPDAAIQGIRAMRKPTVLIGGGYDKQSEYDEWIEAFDGKVKCLVLIGQTREKIAACAKAHGFTNIIMADGLEEAVAVCAQQAEPGDAVLLSPACASWGMFPNYEVRGRMFKELVARMQ